MLSGDSFNDLVYFWNHRARVSPAHWGEPVIAIAREALSHPDQLKDLPRLPRPAGARPDVVVVNPPKLQADVERVFSQVR